MLNLRSSLPYTWILIEHTTSLALRSINYSLLAATCTTRHASDGMVVELIQPHYVIHILARDFPPAAVRQI